MFSSYGLKNNNSTQANQRNLEVWEGQRLFEHTKFGEKAWRNAIHSLIQAEKLRLPQNHIWCDSTSISSTTAPTIMMLLEQHHLRQGKLNSFIRNPFTNKKQFRESRREEVYGGNGSKRAKLSYYVTFLGIYCKPQYSTKRHYCFVACVQREKSESHWTNGKVFKIHLKWWELGIGRKVFKI